VCVCVCVCVRARVRERESKRKRERADLDVAHNELGVRVEVAEEREEVRRVLRVRR
jgi:hypothetical protein